MDFSHYTDEPVELAQALVNTDQRSFDGTDRIADLDGLVTFLADWEALWSGEAEEPGPADVDEVLRLRDRLRQVFQAASADEAADRINDILEDSVARPRLSLHGGAPHLHFEPLGGSVARWLAVVTAMGLATVVADHGIERFGTCSAGDCDDVFVDTSRNRSRRHCSTTCSTREHVAAHRRRMRSGS